MITEVVAQQDALEHARALDNVMSVYLQCVIHKGKITQGGVEIDLSTLSEAAYLDMLIDVAKMRRSAMQELDRYKQT